MGEKCRSCGAGILWAQTITGKSMPVDEVPNHNGNIILEAQADPREPRLARSVDKHGRTVAGSGVVRSVSAGERFMSHFASCPSAATHRKVKP